MLPICFPSLFLQLLILIFSVYYFFLRLSWEKKQGKEPWAFFWEGKFKRALKFPVWHRYPGFLSFQNGICSIQSNIFLLFARSDGEIKYITVFCKLKNSSTVNKMNLSTQCKAYWDEFTCNCSDSVYQKRFIRDMPDSAERHDVLVHFSAIQVWVICLMRKFFFVGGSCTRLPKLPSIKNGTSPHFPIMSICQGAHSRWDPGMQHTRDRLESD